MDIETIELAKSKVKLVAKAAGLRGDYGDAGASPPGAGINAWSTLNPPFQNRLLLLRLFWMQEEFSRMPVYGQTKVFP